MDTNKKEILNSLRFKKLVEVRWLFSLSMAGIMLLVYFGFILTIAFNKSLFAIKVTSSLNIGILLGLGIIVFAWIMTGIYVLWANSNYDRLVDKLKRKVVNQ